MEKNTFQFEVLCTAPTKMMLSVCHSHMTTTMSLQMASMKEMCFVIFKPLLTELTPANYILEESNFNFKYVVVINWAMRFRYS